MRDVGLVADISVDLTASLDSSGDITKSLLLHGQENLCGVLSDLALKQFGVSADNLPEASSVLISAVLNVGKSASSPVASCGGPGYGVGLIVSELRVAVDFFKIRCVQVLLLVVHSNGANGASEVDNVELVVLQVGHFRVVAENEGNGVASLTVPGGGRCEINGELITDGSV